MSAEPVLVTGATGFVGRALVSRLQKDGLEVVGLSSSQGDIADPGTFAPLQRRRFSCVFHLAGLTYVPESWADPAAFRRTNVDGTRNVLEFCRAARAPLVYMSAYVYGVVAHQPIAETVTPRPNNPYAESKFLAEEACKAHAAAHGLAATVLRPFNVYGPGQRLTFLIPTILRQVLEGKVIEVLDTSPRRDWVYLEDVAAAAAAAAGRLQGYRVYNIGSGASISVAELISRIQTVAGTRLPVRSKEQPRDQEIADTVADIGKAMRELGWTPATSLDEGLRRCMEAMRKR